MPTPWPRLLITLIGCCAPLLFSPTQAPAAEKSLHLLASTFPIYQIVRNITEGADSVKTELMIPADLGCPHDYSLTPQDMRKLARADVLVINGLGMEEFIGAPVQKAHPGLEVIDSSRGIKEILHYREETDQHQQAAAAKEDHHGHHHDHHHDEAAGEAANPHLFASPRMAALLAANIADQLARIDPARAGLYRANAQAYGQRMNRLAESLSALGKRLVNNRIVTQHGVFDYLARDMGLEVVAVVQAHAGQEPSAADILAIVARVREKKAGALFTEPQYPQGVGKTIAREAGIAAATLDPVANGPAQAPLDYYDQVMRINQSTLERILGSH